MVALSGLTLARQLNFISCAVVSLLGGASYWKNQGKACWVKRSIVLWICGSTCYWNGLIDSPFRIMVDDEFKVVLM